MKLSSLIQAMRDEAVLFKAESDAVTENIQGVTTTPSQAAQIGYNIGVKDGAAISYIAIANVLENNDFSSCNCGGCKCE